MIDYPIVFLAGLAGSWHCIGMCGGFACGLAANRGSRAAALGRQLLYNTGRVTTYCFLGALVGQLAAGLSVSEPGVPPTAGAQQLLALVSGGLMLVFGLQFLGYLSRFRLPWNTNIGARFLVPALSELRRAPGIGAPLALGVANGFLPCPLVYAFAAQAAGSGGPLPGMLVMLAFGLGTFPAMLLMGGVGGWFWRRILCVDLAGAAGNVREQALAQLAWRERTTLLAGGLILVIGMITFARGVLPLGGHGHHF